ncbi:MAG: glycosyltransferase [Solirubrobacteraceae bacterium]|jgi:GT2 family glycosyltransferase
MTTELLHDDPAASTDPAAPTPVSISVVISAYTEQRFAELLRAVGSVRTQTVAARDVVVVVDFNDELLARAREVLIGVTVVPNDRRPGLAGARNAGAAACAGDVIAYLDDDALAAPDWIEQLTAAYRRPGLLGVGGHIAPRWATRRPRWFPAEFDWVVGCSYTGIPDTPAPIRNPIGANMSVHRSVFDAVGGFREELGRLEETDFCIRAAERFPQRRWLHWPAARVVHCVLPERETWSFFISRCHNEGLAKATMVAMNSRQTGLASEWRHVRVTLPLGVLRGVGDGLHGRPAGFLRAGAIIAGLSATLVGYAKGLLGLRRRRGVAPGLARRGETP